MAFPELSDQIPFATDLPLPVGRLHESDRYRMSPVDTYRSGQPWVVGTPPTIKGMRQFVMRPKTLGDVIISK